MREVEKGVDGHPRRYLQFSYLEVLPLQNPKLSDLSVYGSDTSFAQLSFPAPQSRHPRLLDTPRFRGRVGLPLLQFAHGSPRPLSDRLHVM